LAIDVQSAEAVLTYKRYADRDVPWATHPYWWSISWNTTRYTNSSTPSVWDKLYDDATSSIESMDILSVYVFDDKEENIFIPSRWHYIIVEWLKYRMYGNMWVNFETARNNSRTFYDTEKIKAIQNIVDRWQLADTAYFPDLNFLNY
jgi:hypothetical protein